jgi:hypothetical protein
MLLQKLILFGGACHLGILVASALVPRVLEWRRELRGLSALSRHLVWTHGAFIVGTILALGAVSLAQAEELASGDGLARWVCGFVAVFWGARLAIQLFVFDARPFLTGAWLKAGFHGLTGVFAYLTAVYGWAAVAVR